MTKVTENPFAKAMEKTRVEKDEKNVKIDGVSYKLSDLNENVHKQMNNLRVADQEITRLNHQLAIAQTARNSYAQALGEELPKTDQAQSSKVVQ